MSTPRPIDPKAPEAIQHAAGSIPDPHLEPLPFPLARLSGEQLDHMHVVLERWRQHYGLINDAQAEAARVFMQHCSPRGACDLGIELAAEYLLWFFAMDDMPDGAEKRSALSHVRLILQGHGTDGDNLLNATVDLRARAIEVFGEAATGRLRRFLDLLLAAFEWEAERPGPTPPVALYRQNREHTIAVYPYIELFRLAERADPEEVSWPAIEALEKLCVEIIYLTNDVLSVKRDLRKNNHNLVLGLARNCGITYEAALLQVTGTLRQTVADFSTAHDRLLRTGMLNERSRKYVDYLGTILEGNRAATLVCAQRFLGNG